MTVTLMRFGATLAAAAIVAAVACSVDAAQAQSAQPPATTLPDVPLVAVTSGADAQARPLPSQGRWLLLHIQANCPPCETLLARIQTDARAVAPRLVVVVSGLAPADVARMLAAHTGLEPAAWFADPAGAFSAALHVEGMPLVLAMNDRSIRWTLAGGLSGTERLRDVLTGWVTVPGR